MWLNWGHKVPNLVIFWKKILKLDQLQKKKNTRKWNIMQISPGVYDDLVAQYIWPQNIKFWKKKIEKKFFFSILGQKRHISKEVGQLQKIFRIGQHILKVPSQTKNVIFGPPNSFFSHFEHRKRKNSTFLFPNFSNFKRNKRLYKRVMQKIFTYSESRVNLLYWPQILEELDQ